ncbi:hypothetical protein CI105_04200 [Candidatus Izimaplasma bacterium ZiA1]|uniref:hypothetical protein n=1 Tax=Candidatus Izimoplasma sp. ZiA1 TaxID=2024899 RepID=UPI000BAA3A2A|nr:hypothetical protein CI105_04200 [Candidatus Izimaplasma bacterium ZiA1]
MNKSILIKISVILGVIIAIILASVGCSMIKADPDEAMISNKDDVYATFGDYRVTRGELFDMMMRVDGLDYLLTYVDKLILAENISNVTPSDIENEKTILIYGTLNEGEIALLQSNEENHQVLLTTFENNVKAVGYDPDDPAELTLYLELLAAQRAKARAHVIAAGAESDFFIDNDELEKFYDDNYRNDACALVIEFDSATESKLIFNDLDLVQSFNGGIGEYFNTTVPIEDVASDGFSLTNTIQLSNEQVFTKLVELYNVQNPNNTLPADIDSEDYCNDYADLATYNFTEMTTGVFEGSTIDTFAKYLFDTIDLTNTDTDAKYYSQSPREFGDSFVFVYKVSQEPVEPFGNMTGDEKTELKAALTDSIMDTDLIGYVMEEVREDANFSVVDPFVGIKYQFQSGIEQDLSGDLSIVAKLGDVEITADQLYTYMEERVGAFFAIEIAKEKLAVYGEYYNLYYGSSHDYLSNKADLMKTHRADLSTMKSTFSKNGYSQYGYTTTLLDWNEFLFVLFGVKSDMEALEKQFVLPSLTIDLIQPTINIPDAMEFMQELYDNYFNLYATSITIFLDQDLNFEADEIADVIADMDAIELAEYSALRAHLEDEIRAKLEDDMDFEAIVDEYNDTPIIDTDSVWHDYKVFGFKLKVEDLMSSKDVPLTYTNTQNTALYDQSLVDALFRLYTSYNTDENKELDSMLDTQIISEHDRYRILEVTKGNSFEKPTAVFDSSSTTTVYSEGIDNENPIPTVAQIEIYFKINFAQAKNETPLEKLPSSVSNAITNLYSGIYDLYFQPSGFSIVAIDTMLAGNLTFTENNTLQQAQVELLRDILISTTFPDDYVYTTK